MPTRGGRPVSPAYGSYPVVDDTIDIEVREADLKVDTFRASGAGGQHVNKTESAIRITHVPTGIIVACQTDRSQHRNRATAMAMLKAKLYEAELQRREAVSAQVEANKSDIGWGHQIRSYVLAPYQLVKDLRTGVGKPAIPGPCSTAILTLSWPVRSQPVSARAAWRSRCPGARRSPFRLRLMQNRVMIDTLEKARALPWTRWGLRRQTPTRWGGAAKPETYWLRRGDD